MEVVEATEEPTVAPVTATLEAEPTAAPTEEIIEVLAEGVRLDPAVINDEQFLLVCGYIYEGFVLFENDMIVPALATSWTVSDDKLDYIFELRPGVTFQDGTPFNADIVIANFNRWFGPQDELRTEDDTFTGWENAFGGFKGEVDADGIPKSSFDGIEKVNNLTVLLHLNQDDPELLKKLAQPQFGFINPELLAEEGDLYGTSQGSVVGTGSYTLSEWSNEAVKMEPYADYWGTLEVPILEIPLP